jgi:hypothetical protein
MGCVLLAFFCAAASAETLGPWAELDRRLEAISQAVAEAHFQSALSLAQSTRSELDALAPTDPQAAPRLARLELLAATAEVALGRDARARACLVRALRADPALELDASDTTPKLLRLLPEARRRAAREEGGR